MILLMLLLGGVASLVLAAFILVSGRKYANVVFAAIAICFAIWDIAIAWFLHTSSSQEAMVAARTYYVAAVLFAALLAYFAQLYPEMKRVRPLLTYLIFGGAIFTTACVLWYPNFIFSDITIQNTIYVSVDRPTYIVFSVYFVTFFFAGIITALTKYRKYKGFLRAQSGLYAIGILLTSVPGYIGNLILPYYQNYDYVWIGPAASAFFLGITGYSIIRHRMFDIKIVAARTLSYVLIVGVSGSLYALVIFLLSSSFLGNYHVTPSFLVISTVLALGFSISYPLLKRTFDYLTDRIFFRNDYDAAAVLDQLGDTIARHITLHPLMEKSISLLSKNLHPTLLHMILLDSAESVAYTKTMHSTTVSDDVVKFLTGLPSSLASVSIVEQPLLTHPSTYEEARRLRVAVVMRLETSRGIIGYIALGDKQSGSLYSEKDMDMLRVFSDELAVAIENSTRYEQIREFNVTLQQNIKGATDELRSSNKRLRALDATKDEFISMASHQLRTPLTSIKGYISMLLEGDLGPITDTQRKALEEAYNSSQRMVYLIGDFLNLSRLQTGKFELELSDVSLPQIIAEEIAQLKTTAESRGVTLVYEPPVDFPVIPVDENKLRQVMMNFIDNAIYYAKPEGGGNVSISLISHPHHVSFRVRDNGIGVPAHERPHLFTKFYRAANARKARPDGTGIGLYMAKKVIVAHGGSVIFDSREGEGSEFGFRLPTKNPSD